MNRYELGAPIGNTDSIISIETIRERLLLVNNHAITIDKYNQSATRNGLSFEMSGFDGSTGTAGDCAVYNMAIVNLFADVGIFDYTDFLYLDFHKGTGYIYLRYFQQNEFFAYCVAGYTTCDIIKAIIHLTVLSGHRERRRDRDTEIAYPVT